MIKTISKQVYLPDRFLDNNIKNHLLTILESTYENNCTPEDGYILKIVKINNITDNIISSTNSICIFNINFDIEYLKPVIGTLYIGKICMLFKNGFMTNIQNKMKIFIPSTSIPDFNYIDSYFMNQHLTLQENDEVSIEITNTKYQKNEYICIGMFKNKIN